MMTFDYLDKVAALDAMTGTREDQRHLLGPALPELGTKTKIAGNKSGTYCLMLERVVNPETGEHPLIQR